MERSKSREERAREEKRDSHGRFEATNSNADQMKNQHGNRGQNARNEKRDSQGRFESDSKDRDRKDSSNKNEKRDSHGRFEK